MDVHCTGVGKAPIAFLPEPDFEQLIRGTGLPRHNDNTIVSPTKLKQELACVRARGFSIDDEEDEIGNRCIGAPIFNAAGQVVAAASVSGLVSHITEENSPRLAEQLCQTAAAVSASLGYRPE